MASGHSPRGRIVFAGVIGFAVAVGFGFRLSESHNRINIQFSVSNKKRHIHRL